LLEKIINLLAYGSLLFAAAAAYLQLNKLWTRKHLAEVAESISIPGILVESIPLFFFGLYFLFKGELLGIIDSIIWLISAVLVTMIGAGFWVKGQRKKGFWQLVVNSVVRERAEISTMARAFINPSSAPQLIKVLTSMAAVDGDIDQREIDLIQPFADDWNLDINWAELAVDTSANSRIIATQKAIIEYLDTSPPHAQVAHLLDVLQLLINADETCSNEEKLAFDEMGGQINQYLSDESVAELFTVVIAPQDSEQDEAIRRLMLKDVDAHTYAGGKGYTIGAYFSNSYAEIICAEYRALGFFTVVMEVPVASAAEVA
jgi:hypothetical protein